MSGSVSAENAEPNLTPILDMVFQLITFFILVTNLKAHEMDTQMELPVLGTAAPKGDGNEDVMVVNINAIRELDEETKKPTGRILRREITMVNQVIPNIEARVKADAAESRLKHGIPAPGKLPTTIVLRADATTPFALVNRVITTYQKEGFRTFSLKGKSEN